MLLLIFAILVAAAALVTAPLRNARTRAEAEDAQREARREELEAAKEAKYREIRDAELDFRMGKLSDADFRVVDRQLRAEAVDVLRALDELD